MCLVFASFVRTMAWGEGATTRNTNATQKKIAHFRASEPKWNVRFCPECVRCAWSIVHNSFPAENLDYSDFHYIFIVGKTLSDKLPAIMATLYS